MKTLDQLIEDISTVMSDLDDRIEAINQEDEDPKGSDRFWNSIEAISHLRRARIELRRARNA